MKLPQSPRPLPRLSLLHARWQAVCGFCLERSRTIETTSQRAAWNEIASTEGWCVYEPDGGADAPEPYPICLKCADAKLTPAERAKLRA